MEVLVEKLIFWGFIGLEEGLGLYYYFLEAAETQLIMNVRGIRDIDNQQPNSERRLRPNRRAEDGQQNRQPDSGMPWGDMDFQTTQ